MGEDNVDMCDCGAPLAFSPDGVHCVGCYERRASGDRAPAWSPWFVPFAGPGEVKCHAFCCPNMATWVFTPGGVLLCEACYRRACRELIPERCRYCDQSDGLVVCAICGCACCPEHAWDMRPEVKTLLGFSEGAIECVECVCK
jgi:hypothetical protein